MKHKIILLMVVIGAITISNTYAQSAEMYVTTGSEWIFSFGGTDEGGPIRFSPVVNFQFNLNKDISENLGVYTGLAIRNVGFIWDQPDDPNDPNDPVTRKKFRTYNLGIPVGLKFGNLGGAMLYGGYEFEVPISYKEKTFENEIKVDKFTVFFSDRVKSIQHAVFVGFQLYSGTNVKFKYYLTSLHNKSYNEAGSVTNPTPYANIDSNIFYFSLNFDIFRNTDFYYKKVDRDVSKAVF